MFGVSKKLQYAYLPENLAPKHNIDIKKLRDLKKRHNRVRKLFKGLQGREKNLRNAILKGAKQKNRDFSLKGIDGLLADLQGLESIGELGELGHIGVIATGASIGAASGVLAKIKGWLKPVKNIFNKIRGKAAAKKVAKLANEGKQISQKLQQRVAQYKQQIAPTAQTQSQVHQETYLPVTENAIPQASSFHPPMIKSSSNIPNTPAIIPKPPLMHAQSKNGMSKGAKIGIGIGTLALLGTGAYFAFRKKDDKKPKRKSKKSSTKKTLGSIQLQ